MIELSSLFPVAIGNSSTDLELTISSDYSSESERMWRSFGFARFPR